jgi:hypothetical protein
MQHFSFAKSALLLGILAAACSSKDERSLVVVDVRLDSGVAAPESVHLSASSAGNEVKAADVAWAKATDSVLEVGLFIPSGVAGPVTIAAKGMRGGVEVLVGSLTQQVTLKVGGTVGPFPLILTTGNDAGADGGPSDVGVPDTTTGDAFARDAGDAGAAFAQEVGRDAGLSDVPSSEASAMDTANQPDRATADVGGADVPFAPDVADTNAAQPEVPQIKPDVVEAPEAGHVPAWEPAQNIENDILNASYNPVVAVDPVSEHVYVAWSGNTSVRVKRWNRTTGTWEKTIVVDSRGGPQDVTIGADAKGNVLLVWGQDSSSDSTLIGLWASRTSDGLAWSSPVRITSLYSWNLQLAVARNGTARAVYSKQPADGTWPLYSAYYDGTSWTENPTMVAPNTNFLEQDPRLVVDASGNGILTFYKEDSNYDTGVAAAIFTGPNFSTPIYLDPNYPTVQADSRAVAMNRKGEGVFVWSESTGGTVGVSARTYNPTVGWSAVTPPILSSDTIGALAVAMDEQDNVTILLQQGIASGGLNVMGIHGTVTGSWSDVAVLETDNVAGILTTEYAMPRLAIDASGNVLAVWRKDLSTATTATYGAYASRFAGGKWLPQFQLGLKTGLDVQQVNVSVADSGFGAATFCFGSEQSTSDPLAYNPMVSFYR